MGSGIFHILPHVNLNGSSGEKRVHDQIKRKPLLNNYIRQRLTQITDSSIICGAAVFVK